MIMNYMIKRLVFLFAMMCCINIPVQARSETLACITALAAAEKSCELRRTHTIVLTPIVKALSSFVAHFGLVADSDPLAWVAPE